LSRTSDLAGDIRATGDDAPAVPDRRDAAAAPTAPATAPATRPRSRRPRLMMVGGFTEIYRKAKAQGLDLTVAQRLADIAPADLGTVDQLITAPMDDPGLPDVIAALHRARPFDAVLSFQEHGLLTAAAVRERLALFGNPRDAVLLTRDKALMRDRLAAVGVPSVPHLRSNDPDELRTFGDRAGWPLILKPVRGSGSRQIHRVDTPSELGPALARMYAVDPATRVLAEKWVHGPEVSVEALTWEGRHRVVTVTDKLTTGAPHFVETGHTMPSRLPAGVLGQVREVTFRLLDAVGHRYGPSHTEIVVTADGPVVIETHTRTGGDRIFEMVELTTGVDLFSATLAGFAGDADPLPAGSHRAGAAIRFFDLPPGVVTELSGLRAAAASAGVSRVETRLTPGARTVPLRMSDDRPGFVLATGADASEAARNAEAALALLTIRVTPDGPDGSLRDGPGDGPGGGPAASTGAAAGR